MKDSLLVGLCRVNRNVDIRGIVKNEFMSMLMIYLVVWEGLSWFMIVILLCVVV